MEGKPESFQNAWKGNWKLLWPIQLHGSFIPPARLSPRCGRISNFLVRVPLVLFLLSVICLLGPVDLFQTMLSRIFARAISSFFLHIAFCDSDEEPTSSGSWRKYLNSGISGGNSNGRDRSPSVDQPAPIEGAPPVMNLPGAPSTPSFTTSEVEMLTSIFVLGVEQESQYGAGPSSPPPGAGGENEGTFLPNFPPMSNRDIAAIENLARRQDLFVEAARARLETQGILIRDPEDVRRACSVVWEGWNLRQLRTNARAILNPNSRIYREFLHYFHELNGP